MNNNLSSTQFRTELNFSPLDLSIKEKNSSFSLKTNQTEKIHHFFLYNALIFLSSNITKGFKRVFISKRQKIKNETSKKVSHVNKSQILHQNKIVERKDREEVNELEVIADIKKEREKLSFQPMLSLALSKTSSLEEVEKDFAELKRLGIRFIVGDSKRHLYFENGLFEIQALIWNLPQGEKEKLRPYFFHSHLFKPECGETFISRNGTFVLDEQDNPTTHQLIEKSKVALQNLSAREPIDLKLAKTVKYPDIIDALLNKAHGFCIGEAHTDLLPKQFLIQNMPYLREKGVTTLFMEHLLSDTMQPLLDDYFSSPESQMHPRLLYYLKYLDYKFLHGAPSPTFTEVIEAAKKAGIRVVAIDTTASYCIDHQKSLENRLFAMNYTAREIIKKHLNSTDKFVALMGNCHINHYENVVGVTDIFNCPSIIIRDITWGDHCYILPEDREKHKIPHNLAPSDLLLHLHDYKDPEQIRLRNEIAPYWSNRRGFFYKDEKKSNLKM